MKKCLGGRRVWLSTALGILFVAGASSVSAAQQLCPQNTVCVTTWQQDTGVPSVAPGYAYRTGQNLNESTITYSSIVSDNFGQLCSAQLDGQVYAQPLVLANVTIPSQGYTGPVVYVMTENDTVYAIQGTPPGADQPCRVLLSTSLLVNLFQ